MRDWRRQFWWKGELQHDSLYDSYLQSVSITCCAIKIAWDFDCLLVVRRTSCTQPSSSIPFAGGRSARKSST
jgi:hypothetical protein